MRGRGGETTWWQYAGLLVLAAVTVVLCYLALTHDSDTKPGTALDDPGPSTGLTSTPTDPASSRSADATDDLSTPRLPKVADQRRKDFTEGDDFPDGARIIDGGGNTSGLKLTPRGLTHGDPTGDGLAAGYLETKLKSNVASLGFRVRFADEQSGSVSLVAWQTALLDSFADGGATPATGLRLVAGPGSWRLSVIDGDEDVIAKGTYDGGVGPATFQILRDGPQVFVVDPYGGVTTATSLRAESLAGPWASWGLTETGSEQKPAVIESVWAG